MAVRSWRDFLGNVKLSGVLIVALLLTATTGADQGQSQTILANSDGFVRYQLDSADELCTHSTFVPVGGNETSAKEVSPETLEAHKDFCQRLNTRKKRQAPRMGQQSIRDIAASGAAIESILGGAGDGGGDVPLIFPDTKWCGEGTVATSFDDLGKEALADMCCRAHDHCPRSLGSSTYNEKFDLKNPVGYTVSECTCDDEFKQCLDANEGRDWVSALIKDIYVNILKTPCMKFMHPLKCVKTPTNSNSAECDTFEYDKARSPRWFVVEHPPDSDGPVYRDARGRSLRPTQPSFAEREARAETPERAYTFDMVAKADVQEVKNGKLAQLRAFRAQHSLKARNANQPSS